MVKSYGSITITIIDLAVAYDIQLSNSVIIKDASGVYSPLTINATGRSQPVGQAEQDYTGYFSVAESDDGQSWTTTVAKSAAMSNYSYAYQQKGSSFIRIQMQDEDGNLLSQKIIPIVSEGGDGYTVFLDNENYTFLGDEVAAIKGGSTIVSPIVYRGSTQENVTITGTSTPPDGMTATIADDKKSISFEISADNTLVDSGTIDINFTTDGKQFTKKFSYSVALKGTLGTGYEIVANSQIVRRKYNGVTVPAEVRFTAYAVKTTGRTPYHGVLLIQWSDGTNWHTLSTEKDVFLLSESSINVTTQTGLPIMTSSGATYSNTPPSDYRAMRVRLYPPNTENITDDTEFLAQTTVSIVNMNITDTKAQYYLSDSDTTQSGGSWLDTVPPYNPYTDNKDSSGNVIDRGEIKKYYWQRTVTTYEDGEIVNGAPSLDGELNSTLKSTSNYDIALDQQAMLAKLSQGKDGVFLSKDGKLYINSTYIQSDSIGAGVITGDKITTGLIQSRGKQGGFDIDLDNGIISANKLQVSATGLQIAITKDGNTTFQSLADYMAENGGKMSGDDIVTAINADSTSLSVSAQKLNFNSYKFDLKTDQITIDSDNFKVNSNGEITATGGTIGGYTIGKNTLTSNNTGMGSSSTYWAFWAGASLDEITKDSTSAEFRVSNGGQLYATNATINGSVTATSGKIGGFTINGNTLVGNGSNSIISGGYISGGTIDGASITGGGISGVTITGSIVQAPTTTVQGESGYYVLDSNGLGFRRLSSTGGISQGSYFYFDGEHWNTDAIYCPMLSVQGAGSSAEIGEYYDRANSAYTIAIRGMDIGSDDGPIYSRVSLISGEGQVVVNNNNSSIAGRNVYVGYNDNSTVRIGNGTAKVIINGVTYTGGGSSSTSGLATETWVNNNFLKTSRSVVPVYLYVNNSDSSNTRYETDSKVSSALGSNWRSNWTKKTDLVRFYALE